MTPKIRVVVASRASREAFGAATALGRSLAVCAYPQVELRLAASNSDGLPAVYNRAIDEAAADPAILMFIHDDVSLCDFFWPERVIDATRNYDIAGVAGNTRRVAGQPAWFAVDAALTRDEPRHLSGIVGHGDGYPPANLSAYGPPGRLVKLLDGVLLACDSARLVEHGLRFDERFDFHFYDMDFCRQAEAAGLRMGTCALSVVHQSMGGGFGGAAWQRNRDRYFAKWGT